MKRKTLFLLGSIAAGACLVGGTFAAYAVTDNANPFGIKITPSDGGSSEATETVTLEWGDKTAFTDITNLQIGQTVERTVEVIATTSDSEAYAGTLSLRLTDQTVNPGSIHLINYLDVEVWDADKDDPDATQITYIPTEDDEYSVSATVTVASAEETTLYFYITLDGDMSISDYQTVKNDNVYLEIDWSKNAADAEATNVYVSSTSAPTAYVWNHTSGVSEAEWPGATMTAVSGVANLYSYSVPMGYDRVIFVTNAGQTDDLEITSAVRTTTPYWNGSAWATKPQASTATYYLIGSINGWENLQTDYLFTPTSDATDGQLELKNVQFAANSEFKIVSNDGSTFFGETTTGTSEGTQVFSIGEAGAYDLYFVPSGTTKWSASPDTTIKFIYCTAHQA